MDKGDLLASLPLEPATRRAEHAVRNHDPCISCSTHFLTLSFDQAERSTIVVGLGQPAAGDDGVGLQVARALAAQGIAARESPSRDRARTPRL